MIEGFNKFLPDGYRIECSSAVDVGAQAENLNVITVTTPQGKTTRNVSVPGKDLT